MYHRKCYVFFESNNGDQKILSVVPESVELLDGDEATNFQSVRSVSRLQMLYASETVSKRRRLVLFETERINCCNLTSEPIAFTLSSKRVEKRHRKHRDNLLLLPLIISEESISITTVYAYSVYRARIYCVQQFISFILTVKWMYRRFDLEVYSNVQSYC